RHFSGTIECGGAGCLAGLPRMETRSECVDPTPFTQRHDLVDQQIMRLLSGTARPEEIAGVLRWRAESIENEVRYQELTDVWSATEPASRDTATRVPDVARIIAIASRRANAAAGAAPAGSTLARAAAVVALMVGGMAVGRVLWSSPESLAAVEISTGPNELSNMRLTD